MATREVMPKWVPKISLLERKEELLEPDAEPARQLSSHSNLSEDLQLELEEVKRQLSQVQEVATEAAKRAKEAEQKMAQEVKEQEERRAAARRLLEESQRKRRFQEAKAKAEALELPTLQKDELDSPRKANTPRRLAVPEGGNSPSKSGKLLSQSPKGLKNALKVKRELSRTRHDEVQAVKLAAEQRKKELEAILQQEEKERETFGTLQERLSSAEAAKALLQVQLTTMTVHAERLAFEKEDLRCRLLNTSSPKVFVKQSPVPYFESRSVSRRVRRTFGFTFMVIICMALVAYIKAFRLIDLGHLELPAIQKQRNRSCEPKGVCWLRR